MLELTNCLSEYQTGKTLIRLLPQKQSDLGLPSLYRPFWQGSSVLKFRTFLVSVDLNVYLLQAAKMAKYAKANRLCDILFAIFGLIWFITRLVCYPIK